MKIISERAFNELKESGHCVPRMYNINDYTDAITPFIVGREYNVKFKCGDEILKVRCTQDCPIGIRLI